MKSYPSIMGAGKSLSLKLHTFDKIDGSNLRFEYSNKNGWYKFGTRKRLFDESDVQFGVAIPLFLNTLAGPLENIIKKQRWLRAIVFAEFWGQKSFAGFHIEDDPKFLTVLDVAPYKQGILPPKEFLNLFGEYGPNYLGYIKWTKDFIESVKENKVDGISFEGAVGKTLIKNKIIMYKTKTQDWYDKVFSRFGQKEGKKIAES